MQDVVQAINDLAIEQAALREKIETFLEYNAQDIKVLKEDSKLVYTHQIFMKISIWVYCFLATGYGYNMLKSHF